MTREWEAALQRGDVEALRRLLDEGEDVNVLDRYGQTSLMKAASAGRVDVVQAAHRSRRGFEPHCEIPSHGADARRDRRSRVDCGRDRSPQGPISRSWEVARLDLRG